MRLEETHVKLCLISNLHFGAEIEVVGLRCLQVLHTGRRQQEVPVGDTWSCRSELCTRVSRMFLLCRKDTKGLSEKMEDVSGSFLSTSKFRKMISFTLKLNK